MRDVDYFNILQQNTGEASKKYTLFECNGRYYKDKCILNGYGCVYDLLPALKLSLIN